jgi:hypothetical protein
MDGMPDEPVTIDTHAALATVRRSGVFAAVIRVMLFIAMTCGFILVSLGQSMIGGSMMAAVVAILFMFASRSMRNQQSLSRASSLINAGQLVEAEGALAESIRSFALHRGPRLGSLQNLAALRHAQRRYPEAAAVASALLNQKRPDDQLSRTLRLMLAECSLEMNDLTTAHQALSQIGQQLPVREMLKMLELQVDYCVRVSAWQAALDQLPMKIEMSELLPAESAARVQALLALAAKKLGRDDWAEWLKRRVELLTDPQRLVESREALREVWG